MAWNKIDIVARVVDLLNENSVNTLSQTRTSEKISKMYDIKLPSNIATMSSRFATTIVRLNRLAGTPLVDTWNSIYQIPGDALKLNGITPNLPYEIYADQQLYVNYTADEPLFLEYVKFVDISAASAAFVEFMILDLGAWFAAGIAQNSQLASYYDAKAEKMRALASWLDAQNRPSTPLQSAPIIDIRGGGAPVGRLGEDGGLR